VNLVVARNRDCYPATFIVDVQVSAGGESLREFIVIRVFVAEEVEVDAEFALAALAELVDGGFGEGIDP
jgi:hypothetical protein